jgi:DNA-binding Lrp family transcriptional regulator
MAYRAGELRVDDPEAGELRVTGDGYAAAGEVVTLLVSPDVHLLLGMSEEEVARAAQIERRYREALRQLYSGGEWRPPHADPAALPARQEVEREVGRLLGSERAARLRRLSWRVRGGDALLDEDVADVLRLTGEQRRLVARVAAENEAEYTRVLAESSTVRGRGVERSSDSAGLQGRVRRTHEAGSARLLALLTPEQRERFTRLQAGAG